MNDLAVLVGEEIRCLSHRFGIRGTALEWFRWYLSNRTQFVNINGLTSERHVLQFGVPKGQ